MPGHGELCNLWLTAVYLIYMFIIVNSTPGKSDMWDDLNKNTYKPL